MELTKIKYEGNIETFLHIFRDPNQPDRIFYKIVFFVGQHGSGQNLMAGIVIWIFLPLSNDFFVE